MDDRPTGATRAHDFDAFYAAVGPRLAGQLSYLTRDHDEARDCVQEALERAWLRWDRVGALDDPQAWVRTVAHRLAVSRWRKARNAALAWTEKERHRPSSAAPTAASDERSALVQALRTLPENQRSVLVMHYLVDLDVEQIARETGASAVAVRTRLVRGRRALAAALGEGTLPATARQTTSSREGREPR